jgi:hypothetical protein
MRFNDIAEVMREASSFLFWSGRTCSRAAIAVALWVVGCALGGCAAGGAVSNSFAMASGGGSGATVTFESIDGPPPQVFDRMVGVLDSESKLRNLSIVSRESQAAYRVRSYLAAQVNRGRTTIAWVWDVYDANQQRALRLSGEEPAGKAGRDAWTAADDLVLRRIAQAGFAGLAAMVNGTAPADGSPPMIAPAPDRGGPAVASADPASPASDAFNVSSLSYSSAH